MKTARKILAGIASVAFYAGAVYYFIDGDVFAGVLGAVAGTLFLVSLIFNLKAK